MENAFPLQWVDQDIVNRCKAGVQLHWKIQQSFGKPKLGADWDFGSRMMLESPCLKISGWGKIFSLFKCGS